MDLNERIFRYAAYYPVVWARGQWVPRYLRRLVATQYASSTELTSLQLAKLQRLLSRAAATVPRFRAGELSRTCRSVQGLADLGRLPFSTKADIKQRPDDFRSTAKHWLPTRKTTGGSTGEPLTILKTRDAMAWELAATWRGYAWAGVSIGDRQARFWGVPHDPRARGRAGLVDFVCHRLRCSAFAFDEHDLDRYTERLERFDPTYFYGYVSMIAEYARYFERRHAQPPFHLRSIITTAESLTAADRELIGNTFRTRVFNEYGSGELGSVAHECEHGSLHVSAENMIVEVIRGESPCPPNEVGELVVTELNNHAMPLIRYRTGDFAALSDAPCACGRALPVIDHLFGRAYDTIRNRDGKLFHGEFMMYVFEDAERRKLGIEAFQVVQLALGSFLIKVVPGVDYSPATEAFIVREIRERFDPAADVVFEQVDRIERAPSGKMRLIVGMGDPDPVDLAIAPMERHADPSPRETA